MLKAEVDPQYGPPRFDSDETGALFKLGRAGVYLFFIYDGELDCRRVAEDNTLRCNGGGYYLGQMMLHERAPALECTIASIRVEKMEEGNTPTEHAQLPPPGFIQPPKT
jgi:hypothetical protein